MWANTVTCHLSPSHAFPSYYVIKQRNDTEKQPWYIIMLQAKHIFQSKMLVKRNSILQ